MGMVNSCCCGCTLEQGTIGTGVVSVIRAIICLVIGGLFIQFANSDDWDYNDLKDDHPSGHSKEELEHVTRFVARTFGWGFVLDGVIVLLVAIMLFVGVKTRRSGYLVPWLVIHGISFFVFIPTLIYRSVIGGVPFFAVLFTVGFFIIMVYLYIVVLSLYKSLRMPTSTMVPIPVVIDRYNQPGYVIHPPGAAYAPSGMPPGPPTQAPFLDNKDQPPMYPPGYPPQPGNVPYPQPPGGAPYPQQYNPPPPYSQLV